MSAGRREHEQVIEQLPASLRYWLTLERFHLHHAHLYQRSSRDPNFDAGYLPQNCGVFHLPCFWVPRRHLYMFGGRHEYSAGLPFLSGEGSLERVLFPMHPSSVDRYQAFLREVGARDAAADGLKIWAVATASTRTVLAWPEANPEQATFVKTSLHSSVFGDRRVSRIKAGRSVGLSALLQAELDELPATLCYLPEILAFAPRREPRMGAIIRDIPREIREGRVFVAPLFSLLGGGGDHVPLLLTILERTGMTPLQFVHDVLCRPFAGLWLDLALSHGLLIEAHGQDLLLELSPDGVPQGRFYYRDFEGMQVDWELRRQLGKPALPRPWGQWCWHESYNTWGNHRYTDLTWYKWSISLTQYLHFVLHQTECSLREWHQAGLVRGKPPAQDEVTLIFSQYLFTVLEQQFGMRVGPPYNIYRHLNRFLILLARLRKVSVAAPAAPVSERKRAAC